MCLGSSVKVGNRIQFRRLDCSFCGLLEATELM